jgi:hypothetical protein
VGGLSEFRPVLKAVEFQNSFWESTGLALGDTSSRGCDASAAQARFPSALPPRGTVGGPHCSLNSAESPNAQKGNQYQAKAEYPSVGDSVSQCLSHHETYQEEPCDKTVEARQTGDSRDETVSPVAACFKILIEVEISPLEGKSFNLEPSRAREGRVSLIKPLESGSGAGSESVRVGLTPPSRRVAGADARAPRTDGCLPLCYN